MNAPLISTDCLTILMREYKSECPSNPLIHEPKLNASWVIRNQGIEVLYDHVKAAMLDGRKAYSGVLCRRDKVRH
jgi:hypothetical protein